MLVVESNTNSAYWSNLDSSILIKKESYGHTLKIIGILNIMGKSTENKLEAF